MNTYIILLRGINVGGKNIIPMASLKTYLLEVGFTKVSTYIASGNVLLCSTKPAKDVKTIVEEVLIHNFTLDAQPITVLVLSKLQLQAVVDNKPLGFGEEPDKYHSDVIFLIDIGANEALPVFNPREGVDEIWPGVGVIYSSRLSAERTRSRLIRTMAQKKPRSKKRDTVSRFLVYQG